MTATVDTHRDLHSEHGAQRGEHPGRSVNPLVKVADLAWLEFEKPDLMRAESFARAFGFQTASRTPDEIQLRGTRPGSPCVIVRRAQRTRFAGMAFRAQDEVDVLRLADALDVPARALPETVGGIGVDLRDPSGCPVRVVAATHELPPLPEQRPHTFNFGDQPARINRTQRPPRVPARVERLGHVVMASTRYRATLDWYLDTLGMIVSDFLYFPGQRGRGPTMSFIRCDLGSVPTDHHTLALTLGPANRYVHSAYQVSDLDALTAGGEYLADRGYVRSWGVGRHIQGSQLFDYWRDPDGFLVEHFADGDMFDNTLEPGWAAFTASGLSQWGPPVTRDFLETTARSAREQLSATVSALRDDNEFDANRLLGLMKVARS